MAISGKYFIKKWLPDPTLVHGPDFQGGPPTGGPEGGPGGPGGRLAALLPQWRSLMWS